MNRKPNSWFPASDFPRAAKAITTLGKNPANQQWMSYPRMKYMQVWVDMRSGDFIILDSEGNIVDDATIAGMFPELKD